MNFARKSIVLLVGVLFAVLTAIGTFFFAMAAIIGTFIIAATIALAFFLFKMFDAKGATPRQANTKDSTGSITLEAKRGPKGWTVNEKDRF
jgi:predicted lipid-binding transport protein (Tim44 family)